MCLSCPFQLLSYFERMWFVFVVTIITIVIIHDDEVVTEKIDVARFGRIFRIYSFVFIVDWTNSKT